MKLIVDMNLSPRWIDLLLTEGISSTHWSQLGRADANDVEIMDFARDHDFTVLTHDLDFGAILAATNGRRPSVIQIRAEDVSPGSIGPYIAAAIKQMMAELNAGALLTIDSGRTRLRLLPLRLTDQGN